MELEKKVLSLLESDAKMSIKTIATILEQDEERITDILTKLEQEKVILGYNAIIDWDKLGVDGVTAMIDVKLVPEREVGFNRTAERISRFPEVRCVYLMSGTYDLSVTVQGETMKDIAWFVSHKLSTIDQVQSTVTHFVLKRYKQDNFIFEEPQQDRRLVVSP
ncbi:MAG: Lrp/AsnC family transcriptional regulator [Syntrophomonadaceae bacterium]|jgi:DNA-binding Lrp family transcriptional regulator|nr:Lrp/AsnC family transcriptional regulator [Bacillota bacterium]NLP23070.1 Lrp/AsnC family transcriptional regulator [Syntrophomonadaceae bacterium]